MSETFDYSGAATFVTVGITANYTITADGAAGGAGRNYAGGAGASVTGVFNLAKGDLIEIIVGGGGGSSVNAGGGGGGTFVYDETTGTLLEAAGGGGGAGPFGAGGPGLASTSGGMGPYGAKGGTGGAGGAGGSFNGYGGGGGGGYDTSGGQGAGDGGGAGGGIDFVNGAEGGAGSTEFMGTDNSGGFGGGGGGDGGDGGGGGGYSGGGGDADQSGAGGGGSFVNSAATGASETAGVNAGNGFVTFTPALCYLRGTHILTPTGEKRIEDLKIGDLVVTRFGGMQPIKWIGRQSFAPEDEQNWPIRIRAGALAAQIPAHDLCVSPGHSVLLDGQLILAEFLVNGVTVTRDRVASRIEYFNLDLGRHDCIIAEGAFSETYADAAELRDKFINAAEFYALYPEEPPPEALCLCAPRPEQGEALNAALRPVAARAAALVQPGRLEGYVEKIIDDWYIFGWAHDPAQPQLPVLLEVRAGGKLLGSVLACEPRVDLALAGKGIGRCAFTFKSPVRLKPELLASLTLRRAAEGAELPMNPEIRPERAPETRHLRLVS